jgi:hypothetical protein
MEADRIALTIFGSFNDLLCDQLTHSVQMREVPKRTASVPGGPHRISSRAIFASPRNLPLL